MKTQNEARNLSMVMDLYELTMSNGYFEGDDTGSRVVLMSFTVIIQIKEVFLYLQDWSRL